MSAKTVPNEIAFTGTRDDMSFAGGTIRPVTGGSWVGEGQRAVDGTPERRGAFFSVGGLGDELNRTVQQGQGKRGSSLCSVTRVRRDDSRALGGILEVLSCLCLGHVLFLAEASQVSCSQPEKNKHKHKHKPNQNSLTT